MLSNSIGSTGDQDELAGPAVVVRDAVVKGSAGEIGIHDAEKTKVEKQPEARQRRRMSVTNLLASGCIVSGYE